ncbi:DUF4139 domain-containing protein [Paenimyroides aestuarii]|uniref:Mucoidy inhibitor MuiA family protein n=1 Tax=Paenimyroides aestuarii TaxID=2968490 RepID=A0ABY5NVM3_9FLAO|nr:mucoidy inhibitor MuiA family protein [Paenimyroides aestuarii]UUV22590.1 mucoidy inhibitor MuiA family protein [Paenimyroides aestuarii]
MKNILFPVAVVFSITASAQKPVFTQAQIQSARVYNNAAELKHKASAQIPAGTSEIVITNVANYLNESTVQIGVPKNVTVMSVQFTNAYVEEYDNNQDSPLVKPVKEEIAKKEMELKTLQNQLTAERKSVELLDKNQSMSNAQNFSVAELTKLLDFYKTKRNELANSINKLENQEKTLFEELNILKGKLTFNETTTEKTSQGKLIINVMSNTAGMIPLEVSYLTNQSTWQPSYEMRIDKINEPIQMLYKAQVQQNTGVDWKNVKLSLTSGPANQNTFAPELQPWFLDYYYPNAYRNKEMSEASVASVTSKRIEGRPNADMIQTLQGQVPGLNIAVGKSTMSDYTQISESQLNITFDIDIPYTILSNGKQHSVALKDTKLPATYSYITTPKLDTNAYLIAKVKNYGDYNILPGEANVVFEGMYVGKTYVNANANDDELRLSLGKDQNISVTRTLINDKSGTKTLSSRKVQDFVYEISVRNNKKESISIVVEDQIPISSNTDIEITLTDKGNATTDAEKGKLTWEVNLKPNETKKIRFGYEVKYAKDKTLNF